MTRYEILHNALWTFETPRFCIALFAEEEDIPPEDSFGYQEDIDAVRNREVEYFCAHVGVFLKNEDEPWEEIGRDYLGCCAYKTFKEFYTSHRDTNPMNRNCSIMRAAHGANVSICHYFPGMVYQALDDARSTLKAYKSIPLRAA